MPNDQKKKKTEEILTAWTSLKTKLISLLQNPRTVVYDNYKAPQKTPVALNQREQELLAENQELHRLHTLETYLKDKAENWKGEINDYENRITLAEFQTTQVHRKLEQVRDLVANGQMKKLEKLIREGII